MYEIILSEDIATLRACCLADYTRTFSYLPFRSTLGCVGGVLANPF